MPNQIHMPKILRKHMEEKMIGKDINGFKIQDILGCGNTAVTYRVEDKGGKPWALKLVTKESYGNRAPLREIARFSECEDERFLVFPQEIGDWELSLSKKVYKFIWFKSRIVNGQSLENFIQTNNDWSGNIEISRYLDNISTGLEELIRLGFNHGDLHWRNIMREVIGPNGTNPEIRYVIIDFSESHKIEEPEEGLSKDIESFAQHLRNFYDAIDRKKDAISREELKVLKAIEHIPGLVDGIAEESLGISQPQELNQRFKNALGAVEKMPRELQDPFEPLNSEQITSDALLADLCFTEMWWTSELEKHGNTLLIGPRGCGKTMIFRRLRLKTKIAAERKEEIENDSYIGFYLPCESLFYMRFADLSKVDVAKNKDLLLLYFNMAVINEICSTLAILPKHFKPISTSLISDISTVIKDELSLTPEVICLPDIFTNIEEISIFAMNAMRNIRRAVAYGENLGFHGSTDLIIRIVDIIKRNIPKLSGRNFIFFLDDYTDDRVPIALQEILHPIISQRTPDISFKISSHMFGSIYVIPRPLTLDEGRNIMVINLGTAYLKLNKRRKEGKLLLKILNERFKHCKERYKGTIEKWIGKTRYPGGRTLSRTLHNQNTRSKAYYHGIDCLINLCTGDFSEMIRMVGEIFREGGVKPGDKVHLIAPFKQDKAIHRISREYLSRIRHMWPGGKKLFSIVDSFGNLSKRLVYDREVTQGKTSKGQIRRDPYDLLTIYVDDITKASQAAKDIWERLQKASIFINAGLATSQKSVVADRATLRRIYCPAWRTTLTDSEHLRLDKDRFEYFIDKPDEYCRLYYTNSTKIDMSKSQWSNECNDESTEIEPDRFVYFPKERDKEDYTQKTPNNWIKAITSLPKFSILSNVIDKKEKFDIYIGAMGFESRTSAAATELANQKVTIQNAVLLEFDKFYEETEIQRGPYENVIRKLTQGKAHRPWSAPLDNPDHGFPGKTKSLLNTLSKGKKPRILFDCTSCPSLIHSNILSLLLEYPCELTILYSEAEKYFPTIDEWESAKSQTHIKTVRGPFAGFKYTAMPPLLQSDDIGEHPVLLVLFPTFSTERTTGLLNKIDPTLRIWFFGKPHDLAKNSYRIDMEKLYAAPIMTPGDKWSLLSTFDYKETLVALGGIYAQYHLDNRIVIMPHGSKMQTLAVNLFASVHDASRIFAMPQEYDPKNISEGCSHVWAIKLGDTCELLDKLKSSRSLGKQ